MLLLLFKSGCFSTLIDSVSDSITTSCSSGTFRRCDEDVHAPRSLVTAAGVRGWSIRFWVLSTSAHLICTGSHGDPVCNSTAVWGTPGIVDACRSWGTSARSAPSECHGLPCLDPCLAELQSLSGPGRFCLLDFLKGCTADVSCGTRSPSQLLPDSPAAALRR